MGRWILLVLGAFAFATVTYALTDDFDDGNDEGWTPIQGEWEVKEGMYHQGDSNWTTTTTNETYQRTFFGDVNWSDYTVEVDVIIDEPGNLAPIAGVFVRVTEISKEGRYYFFRIDTRPNWGPGAVESPNNNFAGQDGGKMEGGLDPKFTALEENGVWYHLKVVAEGNHFLYYVDDQLILDITDEVDPFLNGAIGLGTFNCGASFDNLVVVGKGIPQSVYPTGKLAVCWAAIRADSVP